MSIFALIIILLVAAIAYFHYTQGFFSAMQSAMFAVLAAVLAVSYHESLEGLVSRGGLADQSRAITLVVLFAGIYLILRTIFDRFLPGNIRLPLLVDRVGAGVMGVIAGIFATGILALAAQSLPFGPFVMGYSNYEMNDERAVYIPDARGGRNKDAVVQAELKGDSFAPEDRHAMIIPVDDIVLGLVYRLSAGGSLAGSTRFDSVHPDYTQELFAQRLGVQVGAKHSAINEGLQEQARVTGIFQVPPGVPQVDAEIDAIRKRSLKPLNPTSEQLALVIRVQFQASASDKDNLVRLSTGAVRLVLGSENALPGEDAFHNYFPIGTYENNVIFANKPDDPLFVPSGSAADLVFLVSRRNVISENNALKMPPGALVEVKRLAQQDLAGRTIEPAAKLTSTPGAQVKVVRKALVMQKATTTQPAAAN